MRHLSDGNLDRIHAKYKINIRNHQRFALVIDSARTPVKSAKKVRR